MRNVSCGNIYEAVDVINHNTRTFARMVQRANKRIARLEKKNRSFVWVGIIFGVVVELCFLEQNQKIAALNDEVSTLNAEIKELTDKEGD